MARNATSFGIGNRASVRHGLQSGPVTAAKRAETRADVRRVLVDGLPHLEDSDLPLVDLACDVICDLRQVREYLDSRGGIVNRKGQPQGVAGLYGQLMRQAIAIFDRLGIGPLARTQLVGGSVASAKNHQHRQAVEAARELRQLYGPQEREP
jgi:hypothetical protein